MWDLFRKWFGPPPAKETTSDAVSGDRDRNPVVTAGIMGAANDGPKVTAAAAEGEQAKPDYETFCASFCFRPGTKLMDFLEAEGITRLHTWLH